MTDADSHGGFVRMLATRVRLFLAGNTLHSTILGSCTAGPAFALATAGSGASKPSDNKDGTVGTGGKALAALAAPDIDAFTAGESLSAGTGGLFFRTTSAAVNNATQIILNEMLSPATLRALRFPAGSRSFDVPVDASVTQLNVTLAVSGSFASTLQVRDPSGVVLAAGQPGVTEIVSGQSRLLTIVPPALVSGHYTVAVSSAGMHSIAVTGRSTHALSLVGDTTGGVGQPIRVQAEVPSAVKPTALAGPGPGGPGGTLPAVTFAANQPFDPARLQFFIELEDGSNRQRIDLFDDGLHDDRAQGDGIYGGTVVLGKEGRYRVGVTDALLFERVGKLLVVSSAVAVTGPADAIAAPGITLSRNFTIQNLSAAATTYDISIRSTAGWANTAGLPAFITLAPNERRAIAVPVAIPATAASGDADVLTLVAASQIAPDVSDAAAVRTTAFIGPILQALDPATVEQGARLLLFGTFGSDPGAGRRNSDRFNITIAGRRVPDTNIRSWSAGAIEVQVPLDAVSGLTFVVVDARQTNALELVVLPRPDTEPPRISISGSRTTLWPPNGKMVRVQFAGKITDEVSGVNPATVSFAVRDEYGVIGTSGRLKLDAKGAYSFSVELHASRREHDRNGRRYTIVVSASDMRGNASSASFVVTVPHDQGKDHDRDHDDDRDGDGDRDHRK